jgi:hypothetical protein
MAFVAKHKWVLFTEHPRLGLAADAALEGGLVAVLHGSKTSFVLSEIDGGSGEYMTIYQCYI